MRENGGEQTIESWGLGLAASGVNMAVEKLVRDRLSEMCMSICYSLKQEGKREQNRQLIKEICQNVGKQRGKEVAIRVSNDLWRSKENQICSHTLKAFRGRGRSIIGGGTYSYIRVVHH